MSFTNTAANLLIRASSIGTQLAIVPFAISTIGQDAYGLWMASGSIAAITVALDLGTLNATFNIAARCRYRKAADLCAYVAARKAACISLVLLGALAIAAWNVDVSSLLNSQQSSESSRQTLLLVCGISLTTLPFSVFNQLRFARLEISRIAPLLILGNLGGLLCALLASRAQTSQHFFLVAALLPALLAQAIVAIHGAIVHVRIPWRSLLAPLNRASMRVKEHGSQFFLVQIAALGSFHIDNLIIARMMSTSQAAEYSLANRYFSIISILLSVYLTTAWSVYAGLARSGHSERLSRVFVRNLTYSVAFAAASAALLYAFKEPFFARWTRSTVSPGSSLMLALGILSVFNAALGNVSVLMNSVGQLRVQVIISAAMLIPNIALSVWMVGQFGPAGTAAASALCAALMLTCYLWYWKFIRRQQL